VILFFIHTPPNPRYFLETADAVQSTARRPLISSCNSPAGPAAAYPSHPRIRSARSSSCDPPPLVPP